MQNWMNYLPEGITEFLLVIIFSLLIGLSQRRLNLSKEPTLFGTDRTFTLIGLLGYLLYVFTPGNWALYMGGGFALTVLLGLNYYFKVVKLNDYGITSIITALITYCMGPLVCQTPTWFYVSVVVVILLLTEMKSTFVELAHKMDNDEFITLAKFLLMAFIVLPMLPNERVVPDINLTPYKIWLATVIVSGISYLSYLVRKYLLPDSGVFVSGILGGLYSSTATVTILGRKCKKASSEHLQEYIAAMFMAVAMMFLRLMIVVGIFNFQAARYLLIPMTLLMICSGLIGLIARRGNRDYRNVPVEGQIGMEENPLEFKVALIFSVLYVLFTVVTYFTIEWVGTQGLTLLAFISGASDITPFVLNILDIRDMNISIEVLTASVLVATFSNNILKMFYAFGFSGNRKELSKPLFIGFGILSIINLGAILLFL